jgi:MFS transporter, UMF1 family
MNKKQLFLWSLYDFANSIVFINFLLYFGQWLVIDGGLSDFWYNATFAIATVLLILTAPSLAALTDKHGGRKYFLNISTIGTFVSYGTAALLAHGSSPNIWIITLLFLLGQYFYQLSFVFYNPMLSDIADEEHRGRASGIGQFSNALGQVSGLVITLPLAGVRLDPLLPAVGIFFILALPMMIYFKESRVREKTINIEKLKQETKVFTKKFMAFFTASVAAPMLLAFFFFNDALVTLSNNYPIYMDRVFAVPDGTKSLLLMAVLAMSAIGGIIAGWLGDKIGNLKTLKFILIGWVILLPAVALSPNLTIFTITTVMVGLLLGSVTTVTRAYLSNLLSKEEMGYGFSFYTLAERFATFLGPLTWGGLILVLGTESTSYRIAMICMTVFILIGLIILSTWKKVATVAHD